MKKELQQPPRWHKLDNTANLFPVIASRKFSNVYRISVNLIETVDPELLQKALETALPWFPNFRVRLRHGLFWHYLEANSEIPQIHQEDDYPCRYIDPERNRQFLFLMTYYEKRVNLEIFHVLTDGSGGREFLLAVVCQYLFLAYPTRFTPEQKKHHWFAGHAGDTEDSYLANYTPTKKSTFSVGRAFKLKGERNLLGNISVIHNHIALPELKAYCKERQVSITQYLTAVVGWAVYTQQLNGRPPKVPVNIFMPVNLRDMFGSTTSLNFFSNIYISLPFADENITFDDLLLEVQRQFKEKVNKESILEKISYTVGSGYSPFIRVVPLPIKKVFLRAIYEVSAKSSTLGFTNIGPFQIPDPFTEFISGASLMLSCAPKEPFKCTVCSYKNILTFTLTSTLKSMALQREIARLLASHGLVVTIESNGVDYGSL